MRLLSLSLLLLAAAPALRAQVTILDEGTFSRSVNGTRVGREDFSIRAARSAPGAVFVAQANVLEGEERRTLVLNADSLGGPGEIAVAQPLTVWAPASSRIDSFAPFVIDGTSLTETFA